MPKTLVALIFFRYKRSMICWNFNALGRLVKKNFKVVLVRICSLVKFIPIFKFRPYRKELLNPFAYFQTKKT